MKNHETNEHAIFNYTSNIKCSGCVAKVKVELDKLQGITSWRVDLLSQEKLLTVHAMGLDESAIVAAVTKAGFTIHKIEN